MPAPLSLHPQRPPSLDACPLSDDRHLRCLQSKVCMRTTNWLSGFHWHQVIHTAAEWHKLHSRLTQSVLRLWLLMGWREVRGWEGGALHTPRHVNSQTMDMLHETCRYASLSSNVCACAPLSSQTSLPAEEWSPPSLTAQRPQTRCLVRFPLGLGPGAAYTTHATPPPRALRDSPPTSPDGALQCATPFQKRLELQ